MNEIRENIITVILTLAFLALSIYIVVSGGAQ